MSIGTGVRVDYGGVVGVGTVEGVGKGGRGVACLIEIRTRAAHTAWTRVRRSRMSFHIYRELLMYDCSLIMVPSQGRFLPLTSPLPCSLCVLDDAKASGMWGI